MQFDKPPIDSLVTDFGWASQQPSYEGETVWTKRPNLATVRNGNYRVGINELVKHFWGDFRNQVERFYKK